MPSTIEAVQNQQANLKEKRKKKSVKLVHISSNMLRASYVDTSILATASPRESAGGLAADRDEVHTHLQWRALLPCCAAVAPARWWKEQGSGKLRRFHF